VNRAAPTGLAKLRTRAARIEGRIAAAAAACFTQFN